MTCNSAVRQVTARRSRYGIMGYIGEKLPILLYVSRLLSSATSQVIELSATIPRRYTKAAHHGISLQTKHRAPQGDEGLQEPNQGRLGKRQIQEGPLDWEE